MKNDHEQENVEKRTSFLFIIHIERKIRTCKFTAVRTLNGFGPPRKSSMQYNMGRSKEQ